MKNLLTKICSKYLLISFALNLVVFLVFFAINKFHFMYETNDDFFLSHFIVNGYDKCLFISYFITVILVPIQRIFTIINVWMVSQFLFNFLSVMIIVYIFLSKFGMKLGISFSVLFHVAFGYYNFISLQFTRTPATMATAGYLLIVWSLFSDRKNNYRWINVKSIIGTVLVILSSFYRFASFLSVSGVFFVFLFALLFVRWLWSWREKTKINYFLLMKKLVFVVLVFVMAFSLEKVSGYIKTSNNGYLYHEKYQTARSNCIDILPSTYEGNEKFYNSIDMFSENDVLALWTWTVSDKDFFTLEKLTAIAEYSKKDTGLMNRISQLSTTAYNILANKFGSACNIAIITASICCLIFLLVLFVFRNKCKWIFPFLFTAVWLAFLYLYYLCYDYMRTNHSVHVAFSLIYLIIFPGILMIFLSFIGNRYHFIVQCFISGVLFALIMYLEFTRINFRAAYTVIFPAMCIILYDFDKKNLQVDIVKICSNLKKGISVAGLTVYLAVVIIIIRIFPFPEIPKNNYAPFTYIKNHKENFYFLDSFQNNAMENSNNPMLKPELASNTVHTSWPTGSVFFDKIQQKYNMNHLYADMIDNPNAFYVSDRKISMVEKYYNDHYSNGKNNIVFERVENDIMEVYRICTKN